MYLARLFTSSNPTTVNFKLITFKRDDTPKVAFEERSKGKEEDKEMANVEVAPSKDMVTTPIIVLPRRP